MQRRRTAPLLSALLLALLVLPALGRAADPASTDSLWRKPLQSRNQFPVLLLFLGFEPERAASLGAGETSFNLDLGLTNIIRNSAVSPDPSSDRLKLDYEYWRIMPQYQVGLGRGFEASVSLPLFYRGGGFMDAFISSFHETFGFTNNVRRRTPNDQFVYDFRIGGRQVVGPLERGMVLGDLVLAVKKSWNLSGTEVGLRAALKAPTGSWERAAGSGGFDLGLGFLLSGSGRRVGYVLNAGYYILGPSKIPGLVPRNYFSLMGGLDFLIGRRFDLLIQVDGDSRFVESLIPILDKPTGQITAGFRWRLAQRVCLEFRLSEDLAATNPDFTFGLRLEFLTLKPR